MDLSNLDQKSVAVFLPVSPLRVVFGYAVYDHDETFGNVLRVRLDREQAGYAELMIRASEWQGRVARDDWYGCDYVLTNASDGDSAQVAPLGSFP